MKNITKIFTVLMLALIAMSSSYSADALKRKGMVCTAEYNKAHPDAKVALATYDENQNCVAKDNSAALKKKGMVCTAEYNKAHPDAKVALATYDENQNCVAKDNSAALKKKGMVCTAEYNKAHPDAKVALATYDENQNCVAKDNSAALKKKGMVCTAEYNKAHPDAKVALATYDENQNCIAKDKKGETETGETDGTTPEAETEGSEEEKQKAYDEAKANEQSTANKTLTATTTAATGIGTMELLQGRAEQKADKEAAESMAAYIATMRCTYGEDKQVKAGPDEIELPGGNNQDLMNYRAEYLALANDLKERKTALGMKPGIESEEIIDKASTGLYDDENLGITSGAYASLYRAQMLGSETDQAKIDEAAKTSKNRVLGGAIAAGAGVVIGVAGNSLINGKLGELIKKKMNKDESSSENEAAIKSLKDGLNQTGMKNVDKLDLSAFDISELQEYIDGTDFSLYDLSNFDATTDIDTTDSSTIESSLKTLLSDNNKRPTE